MNCAFCGKTSTQVRHLVARGPLGICDQCIERCVEVCNEHVRPPIAALKTKSGRDLPDTTWRRIDPDAAEVVISRLLGEIEKLERSASEAESRGLLSHAFRLSGRVRNLHSAMRELGFEDRIRARCIGDYLESLPEWYGGADAICREFTYATLLRWIPGLAQEAEGAFVHGLDVYAARFLAVAGAYRAAAIHLGWGADLALAG